jgi:restriction endonuclease S subunit
MELLYNSYLDIPIYCNDANINIVSKNITIDRNNFTLQIKNINICLQKYFNYYFYNVIIPIIKSVVNGKLCKIDYDALLNLPILIPSLDIQNVIISYFDLNYNIINTNKNQILDYIKLSNQYIELMLTNCDSDILLNVCNITNNYVYNNKPIITIQSNSNSIGEVSYYENDMSEVFHNNNNIYYIEAKPSIVDKYLYYILKNSEPKLYSIGCLTKNKKINKTNLENFQIKIIDIELQKKLISKCDNYNNMCIKLEKVNKNINNVDIIQTLYSLHS